jgi:hypothetical protein
MDADNDPTLARVSPFGIRDPMKSVRIEGKKAVLLRA